MALSLWIEDRNQKRVPLSGSMVREKAKRLYVHFKEPADSCSGECTDGGFQTSEGWFNKFKQDEDLTETDLEEMLISQPIEEEASTSTGHLTFNLKSVSEGLRMANELCDFFTNIDPPMERSLIFKTQIANATAAYQYELKELLKTAKQEKITKKIQLIKMFQNFN
uniref:HTH CENPB-type domain-containing protein n=1 Tax=Glossina austeni TaxID=7395 RepID=A0A1A9VDB6_GLOAU